MNFSFVILSFLCFFVACKSSKNGEGDQNTLLVGDWMVSHEEGSREEIILRPSDYNFPLSRMRDEFIFHKDNTLTYNTLGPADRPVTKKGKWELTEEGVLILYVDELNTFRWKVERLENDILHVIKK